MVVSEQSLQISGETAGATEETDLEAALTDPVAQARYLKIFHLCFGFAVVCYFAYAAVLFLIPEAVWPETPRSQLVHKILCGLWICAFAGEIVDMLSFSLITPKMTEPRAKGAIEDRLVVQFVSRAENVDVLLHSARRAHDLLSADGGIPYSIRIVIDSSPPPEMTAQDLTPFTVVEVPREFSTANGTLYKARSLEYARIALDAKPSTTGRKWILFLDEESVLTASAVTGLKGFMRNEHGKDSIGQGFITYTGGRFGSHRLISAADAFRVGWDLGRYRLQYRWFGRMFSGFHGSNFIVPQNVLNRITFDVGKKASLTEDIYFAAAAAEQGVRFRWVDGFVREQSPERIADFFRQRRRWINGLARFLFDGRVSWRSRLPVCWNLIMLRASGLATAVLAVYGRGTVAPSWQGLAVAYLAAWKPAYVVGVLSMLADSSRKLRWRYLWPFVFLAPAASLLESAATAFALLRPRGAFDVVKKSAEA